MSKEAPQGPEIPTFRPRNDTVILQRIEIGAPKHGVVRPGTSATEYELYSEFVVVGPTVNKNREDDLSPGDRVIGFFKGAVPVHTKLPIYAIQEEYVFAIVEGGGGTVAREPSSGGGRIIQPPAGTFVPPPKSL